jgi:hypothetical protein
MEPARRQHSVRRTACGDLRPQQGRLTNERRFLHNANSIIPFATNTMKTLPFFVTALTAAVLSTTTGLAKDKDKDKHKDKDWNRDHDHDRSRTVYVERDSRPRDRERTIYVIERDRPVQRTVYVDGDGRYYRWSDGRRVYVRERYFDSYPSKYYHQDGRRRVTISLPF